MGQTKSNRSSIPHLRTWGRWGEGERERGRERESIPHQRLCFLWVDHPKNPDGFLQVTLNYLMASGFWSISSSKKNLPKAWLKGKFTESPFLFFALSQGPGSKSLVCSAHRLAPGVDWCTVAVVIFLFTSKRENLVLLPLCFEIHIILYYIIYYYILLMVKKWFSVDGPWKQYIDNCYFSIPWLRHRTLEAPHERLDPTPKKTLKQTIYVYIYMM